MYPCCNNVVTKRKLVIMSLIAIAIVSTFYFILASTSNISGLAISGVLGLAACPIICAAMGGGMWAANRFTNKKNQIVNREKEPTKNSYAKPEHEGLENTA